MRNTTGEDDLTSLLNLQSFVDPQKRRIVEVILEKRKVLKTIGTYLAALPDYDGKMKTTYFPCLETGRSSTGQLDPPVRPTIEIKDEYGKKKKKVIGCAFQTITKHGDTGADIRSQYVPEKGYVFVQADSAQAEARVVFLLAEDYQALKDIDEHDYHALTASWFFGGSESDYSKSVLGYEHPIRFAGKTLRHAGHLGAGKRRAATSVNTDARKFKVDIRISEGEADRALRIFHAKQPKIQRVFHAGIISSLEKSRVLTAGLPYGIDADIGGRRTFFERWGDELFRSAFSYIPQRSISDNTKAAGLRLRKQYHELRHIILESHDSLLFMVREKDVDSMAPLIKTEFERPIRFENCTLSRPDLVIPCEIEVGYNYQDLKKLKGLNHVPVPIPVAPEKRARTVQEEFIVDDA
jgi:DNA polymerase I-like protein with 3'-5' exonuclease and polymerase domains